MEWPLSYKISTTTSPSSPPPSSRCDTNPSQNLNYILKLSIPEEVRVSVRKKGSGFKVLFDSDKWCHFFSESGSVPSHFIPGEIERYSDSQIVQVFVEFDKDKSVLTVTSQDRWMATQQSLILSDLLTSVTSGFEYKIFSVERMHCYTGTEDLYYYHFHVGRSDNGPSLGFSFKRNQFSPLLAHFNVNSAKKLEGKTFLSLLSTPSSAINYLVHQIKTNNKYTPPTKDEIFLSLMKSISKVQPPEFFHKEIDEWSRYIFMRSLFEPQKRSGSLSTVQISPTSNIAPQTTINTTTPTTTTTATSTPGTAASPINANPTAQTNNNLYETKRHTVSQNLHQQRVMKDKWFSKFQESIQFYSKGKTEFFQITNPQLPSSGSGSLEETTNQTQINNINNNSPFIRYSSRFFSEHPHHHRHNTQLYVVRNLKKRRSLIILFKPTSDGIEWSLYQEPQQQEQLQPTTTPTSNVPGNNNNNIHSHSHHVRRQTNLHSQSQSSLVRISRAPTVNPSLTSKQSRMSKAQSQSQTNIRQSLLFENQSSNHSSTNFPSSGTSIHPTSMTSSQRKIRPLSVKIPRSKVRNPPSAPTSPRQSPTFLLSARNSITSSFSSLTPTTTRSTKHRSVIIDKKQQQQQQQQQQ